jgi:hypothetical protein
VINLGTGEPIVLNDAIGWQSSLIGGKAVMERKPFQPADVLATWADIQKARRLLKSRMAVDDTI